MRGVLEVHLNSCGFGFFRPGKQFSGRCGLAWAFSFHPFGRSVLIFCHPADLFGQLFPVRQVKLVFRYKKFV